MRRSVFLIALGVILADQGSKAWMSAFLADRQAVPVMPGLAWELAHNNGAAFGVMEGGNVKLIVAAALAVVLLLYWVRQVYAWPMAASLGLLLGGAVGNLIDRVRLGHVVDFIAFQYRGQTVFPNFNIADCAITVGAVLLAYSWFRVEQDRSLDEETAEDPVAAASPSVHEEAR